jgi:hypothetical protein
VTRELDTIIAARTRLRGRSVRSIAEALAAAAARWRDDPEVRTELARTTDLSPAMLEAVLPLVAEPIDADALVELHAREGQAHGPALIAHVLASNVPALAVPAITLSCLAGAAVVVKSGRADRVSRPAFARAVAEVDPDLGATILATYWPHEATRCERRCWRGRRRHRSPARTRRSPRSRGGRTPRRRARCADERRADRATAADAEIAALASTSSRYEQRGCLSPTTVFVAVATSSVRPARPGALDASASRFRLRSRRRRARASRRARSRTVRGRDGARRKRRRGRAGVRAGAIDDALTGRTRRGASARGATRRPFRRGEIECVGIDAVIEIDEPSSGARRLPHLPRRPHAAPAHRLAARAAACAGLALPRRDEPRIQVES